MEKEYEVKLWIRYEEGGFEMQKFTTRAKNDVMAINQVESMACDTYGGHCVSDMVLQYCKEIKKDNKRA